jgi:hypothetical protein
VTTTRLWPYHRVLLGFGYVVARPQSATRVWLFRVVNGSFLLVSLLVPIVLLIQSYPVSPTASACFILVGLLVHMTYLATALVEAGLERYIFPTWPIMIAALVLLPRVVKIPTHSTAKTLE